MLGESKLSVLARFRPDGTKMVVNCYLVQMNLSRVYF